MKVGDLVKYRCPSTPDIGKVFLVLEVDEVGDWVRLQDEPGYIRCTDVEVLSESR